MNFCVAGDEFPFPALAPSAWISLAEGWKFHWDDKDEGLAARWWSVNFPRQNWEKTTVPGVWDNPPGHVPSKTKEGIAWFAKTIEIPGGWDGELSLLFLSAMYSADIWADDKYLLYHKGGFTPFIVPLGDRSALGTGKKIELILRIGNKLSDKTIPSANLGWNNYGGLTREVYLMCRPRARVENLRAITKLQSANFATLDISGNLVGDSNSILPLAVRLKSGTGIAAECEIRNDDLRENDAAFAKRLSIKTPHLWSPETPFLHNLELIAPDGRKILSMPLGLREIRLDGRKLLLNNKEYWLQGFGQHEEAKDYGPCIPPDFLKREIRRMKEFGANHIRGHYPYHPLVYSLCDRIGMLAFAEIPAWQIKSPWADSEEAWEQWARPQLDEMIRGYANFTSIASWSAANEMGWAEQYHKRAINFIAESDPSRIPTAVVAATVAFPVYEIIPFAARNLHYGFYHSKNVYDLRNALAENLKCAEARNIPLWISEMGGKAWKGRFTGSYSDGHPDSEFYSDRNLRFGFQYCATASERVCGIAVWTWSDFHRKDSALIAHGIFDIARAPKLMAYTVKNLFAGDIRLFLCEDNTACSPGGTFRAKAFIFNPKRISPPEKLKLRRLIQKGATTLHSEEEQIQVSSSARSIQISDISWQIPRNASGLHSLWAELLDTEGHRIHCNSIHFRVGEGKSPGVLALTALSGEKNIDAEADFGQMKIPIYKDPGLIIPLDEGDYSINLISNGKTQKANFKIISGEETRMDAEFFSD